MAQSKFQKRKLELVTVLAAQRTGVSSALAGLERELSVSRQLKKSVKDHPLPWFAGAFGSAAFLGLLLRSSKRNGSVKRSRIGILLGLCFSLAKPAITAWVIDKAKEEASRRFLPQNRNSMLGEPR
jgi:hypothetical protein